MYIKTYIFDAVKIISACIFIQRYFNPRSHDYLRFDEGIVNQNIRYGLNLIASKKTNFMRFARVMIYGRIYYFKKKQERFRS